MSFAKVLPEAIAQLVALGFMRLGCGFSLRTLRLLWKFFCTLHDANSLSVSRYAAMHCGIGSLEHVQQTEPTCRTRGSVQQRRR